MHELSICASVASIAAEHAGGRAVERVHLDIGHLRQVVPETLRFSWDVVVADGPLAGSQLVINHIPATLVCRVCAAETTLDAPIMRCPCGSTDTDVITGRELLVRSLELADAPTPT